MPAEAQLPSVVTRRSQLCMSGERGVCAMAAGVIATGTHDAVMAADAVVAANRELLRKRLDIASFFSLAPKIWSVHGTAQSKIDM